MWPGDRLLLLLLCPPDKPELCRPPLCPECWEEENEGCGEGTGVWPVEKLLEVPLPWKSGTEKL